MYNNWLSKLTESYINSKRELTESEMILEELNETKEYSQILESLLNELLVNEIITEEDLNELFKGLGKKLAAGAVGLAAGCGSNDAPCPTPQPTVHAGAEGQAYLLKPKAKSEAKSEAKPKYRPQKGAGAEGEL